MRRWRRWTNIDEQRLSVLWKFGYSVDGLADRFNTTRCGVLKRVDLLRKRYGEVEGYKLFPRRGPANARRKAA